MNGELAQLFREGMVLLGTVGGPLLGGLLIVGLVVGAVPRIATIVTLCILLGPWLVERLARFLSSSIERMAQ
jgi:flagellar biosynthesis protein FliQ